MDDNPVLMVLGYIQEKGKSVPVLSYLSRGFYSISGSNLFYNHYSAYFKIQKKIEPLNKAKHNKTENDAGSVWLSQFMDGSCKLPSTSPSKND